VGTAPPAVAAKPVAGLTDGLDLPEVQTIGDLQPEALRAVIRIDHEGVFSVDGGPTSGERATGRHLTQPTTSHRMSNTTRRASTTRGVTSALT
jgi:hypothetical protein